MNYRVYSSHVKILSVLGPERNLCFYKNGILFGRPRINHKENCVFINTRSNKRINFILENLETNYKINEMLTKFKLKEAMAYYQPTAPERTKRRM